jgi:hypothetical protein
LADALREAYGELFALNTKAQNMSVEEVKNKLKTLTLGQKSDKVLSLMANTFRALADLADWDAPAIAAAPDLEPLANSQPAEPATLSESGLPKSGNLQLHYNIQVHLPESRDPAVYDAIFQALRKHLA